ncbi:adaptor complex AP-3 domain-containing protein [Polychytrium aggregatum]|uniref:adaptor complex AP-3 domain-containing protein n=1 Tax=Polychytrium aggregatum TaxID=110093 RepID=UPI0022FE0274|nr:adaptor complex AP-3 domain-containing protein [Polychytrium aggregatum]KAI9203109.1 Mu homology domain-containing protein [Polychytrium aggregatum]
MIDSIFITDGAGKVLVEKHYHAITPRSLVDQYWSTTKSSKRGVPPVAQVSSFYFHRISKGGVFFLAVSEFEAPPLEVLSFLHRTVEIFEDYFGAISETAIKEHFVIIYELLDELLDYGSPYITEPNILKELVPPPSLLNTVINAVAIGTAFGTKQPVGTISNVPWRSSGIKYITNEVFFDINEVVDCILDRNSNVVTGQIHGEIQCNARLSGMPECLLSFTNSRVFEDSMVSLHPSVKHARFERDRCLSFIPPDGNFKLMAFETPLLSHQGLPISVRVQFHAYNQNGKFSISLQPRYTAGGSLEKCIIYFDVPEGVVPTKLNASIGTGNFDQMNNQVRWDLGKIPKDFMSSGVPIFTGELNCGPEHSEFLSLTRTVCVEFKASMYSASGLKIDTLQLHHEDYTPFKGVRSMTRSGKFQIRV